MKERPILFSSKMVLALLAGTKTQTRRILKWEPSPIGDYKLVRLPGTRQAIYLDDALGLAWRPAGGDDLEPWPAERIGEVCPYGAPGDRLWVREGVRLVGRAGDDTGSPYGPDDNLEHDLAAYIADSSTTPLDTWPWKRETLPGIHMPRGLCRIHLEIVSARAERLADISEADAMAEGVRPFFEVYDRIGPDQRICTGELARDAPYRASYACLWDEINGDRALWSSNPWVWAVEFRRVETV